MSDPLHWQGSATGWIVAQPARSLRIYHVQIPTLRIWNWNMGVSQYSSRYSREIVARSIRRSTQAASTGVGTALVPQVEAAPLFSHFSFFAIPPQ
jgi:hypothetical protein